MACQDSNTGIAVQVSSKSPNVAFAIVVSGTGNTRTVVLQSDVAGYYDFHYWLSDSATDPEVSTTLPDGGGGADWIETSNSSGVVTRSITHSGAHTWYVWGVLIGPATVESDDPLIFT